MSRRQHLGTVYTSYPAKDIGERMGATLFKTIMAIICCFLWTGAFYVMAGVVNFVRGNVSNEIDSSTSTMEIFRNPIGLGIFIVGALMVVAGVFRSKMGEKSNVYNKNNRNPIQ